MNEAQIHVTTVVDQMEIKVTLTVYFDDLSTNLPWKNAGAAIAQCIRASVAAGQEERMSVKGLTRQ